MSTQTAVDEDVYACIKLRAVVNWIQLTLMIQYKCNYGCNYNQLDNVYRDAVVLITRTHTRNNCSDWFRGV